MTDTGNEERPLTRRELRARERAAAAAAEAEAREQEQAQEPAVEEPAVEEPVVDEPAGEDEPALEEPAVEESAVVEEPAVDEEPETVAVTEPAETEAYTIDDLREVGLVAEEGAPAPEAPQAEPEAPAADEESASSKRGIGRFFGRKSKPETTQEPDEDFDSLIGTGSTQSDAQPEPESEPEAVEPATGGIEDLFVPEAEPAEEEHAEQEDPTQEVAGPARASGSRNVPLDAAQHLDSVRDEDVDSVEIDEVEVDERRISARTVSDSTPVQMEDTRGASFENDAEQPSGPSRGRSGRLPFVVNVVEDTSEHHISDLHRGRENVEGKNVGTGSSNITANALVLPATGQEDQIQFESEDGVLVTGSIDLPDGFASSGRARGAFDSPEIDAATDGSEVSNPETQPVRASRAVSSYANARVSIAPKRQSRSALPWVLGIGGGVVVGAIVVVTVGFLIGWF